MAEVEFCLIQAKQLSVHLSLDRSQSCRSFDAVAKFIPSTPFQYSVTLGRLSC